MTYSKWSTCKGIPILGYTTRRHLLLDLDNTTEVKATRLSQLMMKQWPKLGDALLVESSARKDVIGLKYSWNNAPYMSRKGSNYHLIFDNNIGYNTACKICEVLAGLQVLNKDYLKIRKFRGDMTLRISPITMMMSIKPMPVPLTTIKNVHTNRHDGYIANYLNLLNIAHNLFTTNTNPETKPNNRSNSANNTDKQHAINILPQSNTHDSS